jgi:AraC family transcriptional regulator
MFFGQARGRLAFGGLTFVESIYAPETVIPRHEHADPFFYYVLDGVCAEESGRGSWEGGPSSLVFHPAGAWHANRWPGSGGRCLHIEIARDRLQRLNDHAPMAEKTVDFLAGPAAGLAGRLYQEYQHRDGATPLALEGLTLEILAEVSRASSGISEPRPPRWLLEARDFLHDRFATSVSLDDVAAAVKIDPTHLARVFRRHFGCSLGDYLRRLRIEFARCQLAESDRPLNLVALDAGFVDQSHFCRLFKRHTGMTPTQFQNSHREPKQTIGRQD